MTLQKLYDPTKGPMRLAIFMSGSGSNAVKILERAVAQRERGEVSFNPVLVFSDNPKSNALKIANTFGVSYSLNSIRDFYEGRSAPLNDMTTRTRYDQEQQGLLEDLKIDAIALAGYDWVLSPELCEDYLISNVHPGNLRTRGTDGRRRYIGLGWIPSAKAILNREENVYTSVHLVTSGLDEGPLLAVSAPQPVPKEALSLEKKVLLGGAMSLKEVTAFIKSHPELGEEEIVKIFPIYRYARDCQERLKVHGDWIEFPEAIENISLGRYQTDEQGKLYFEGNPIPNGLEREAA